MPPISRRRFLGVAGITSLALAMSTREQAHAAAASSKPKGPAEVKELLEGPVNSIPTSFLPNGDVDWKGVRNIIETGISGGSNVSLLTRGDSRFEYLSDDEIAQLTRILVDQVKGRALTVAATDTWWTGQAVQFARFCKDIGVDVLMVSPPAGTTDGLIAHYRAVAEVMPIMLVGHVSYDVIDGLLDMPNACCFKEDYTEEWAFESEDRYGKHFKFMTGGGLARHWRQWPHGVTAFMSWPSSFAPHVARRYWRAVQAGHKRIVEKVLEEVEAPFFKAAMEFPAGFHAFWRAALELNGVASRWLRPPQETATEEQLEQIKNQLDEWGLLT